jgi:uncharacterized protein (DUF2235 family)
MKNIAVFCDGTWNHLDMVEPTNVGILSRNVLPVTSAGVVQRAIYLPGVGTRKKAAGPIERAVDRLTGGAFGWGLDARLEAAYREVAAAYEPGDRLFLFGFSRGAYMARSLAGLLRNCGLPEPATVGRIGEAMTLYRNREPGSHPDSPASLRFRAAFSPRYATSETDRMVRTGQVEMLAVDYLGVWDTVGALGVPDHFAGLAAITNGKYKFHDLRLSSMVKSARHAVAIDERRRTFPPTLWENLTDLNIGEGDLPYRQEWFPGTHGGVGGGGPIRGLSNAALLWILGGAEEAGLEISPAMKDAAQRTVVVDAPLDNHPPKTGPLAGLFKGKGVDRSPPSSIRSVSWMARERWRLHGYRPVPLRPFGPKMEPPVMPGEWRD